MVAGKRTESQKIEDGKRQSAHGVIDLMLSEAIKTSVIEGENLYRESVRSSLLSLIVSDTLPSGTDQKAAGAAAFLKNTRTSS